MGGIVTLVLLGVSIISPSKREFHRWEKTKAIQKVYVQDSLNLRLVGRWPYGVNNGMTLSKNYVYLGCGTVVFVLDVSDVENPQKIAEIKIPEVVRGLNIYQNCLYITTREALRIIDVSSPEEPKEKGIYSANDSFKLFYKTEVCNGYAYISSFFERLDILLILDIQNPQNPKRVGMLKVSGGIRDFSIQEGFAYIAEGEDGLTIADISDPSNPQKVGEYEEEADGVVVAGSYAYITADKELEIIDISDPSHPQKVGSYKRENLEMFFDVYVKGSHLYLSTYERRGSSPYFLRILNISDPCEPEEVGFYLLPQSCEKIVVKDSIAYLLFQDRIYILNVSDPSHPTRECTYSTPGPLYSVYVSPPYLYTGGTDGLRIFDISEPENIKEVGFDEGYPIFSLWAVPPFVYEACGDGLWIVDISQASNPYKVGKTDVKGYAKDIFFLDPLIYIANILGLQIVLPVPPSAPQNLGSCSTIGVNYSVWVSDSYAYMANIDVGLIVVDVSNPDSPKAIKHYSAKNGGWDVWGAGDLLFLATRSSDEGVLIFDISNPTHPEKITSIEEAADKIYAKDSLLYLLGVGLKIMDVSNPMNPKEIGFYPLPLSFENGISIFGNYIYITDPYAGLFILEYYGKQGREETSGHLPYPSFAISPNPVKQRLHITYNLSQNENVIISLYDATGRLVKILERGERVAGSYEREFNLRGISPGIYFIRFEGKSYKTIGKIIIM